MFYVVEVWRAFRENEERISSAGKNVALKCGVGEERMR